MPRLLKFIPIALALSACTGAARNTLSPAYLEGAWKLTQQTWDGEDVPSTGYMFFHGRYYSFLTNTPRPDLPREAARKGPSEMTETEKDLVVEAFHSMTAAAGTYLIDGDQISYVMEVVRSPHLTGNTSSKRRCRLEGDRMIQEFTGGGHHRVMVWEKVAGKEN